MATPAPTTSAPSRHTLPQPCATPISLLCMRMHMRTACPSHLGAALHPDTPSLSHVRPQFRSFACVCTCARLAPRTLGPRSIPTHPPSAMGDPCFAPLHAYAHAHGLPLAPWGRAPSGHTLPQPWATPISLLCMCTRHICGCHLRKKVAGHVGCAVEQHCGW
jgi:hypothetical protein